MSDIRPWRIATWVAGGDAGRSGLGVYFREILPRLREELGARGGTLIALGTRIDLDAAGLADSGPETIVLPRVFDRSGVSAATSLVFGDTLARLARADVVYLPAANRRSMRAGRVPIVGTVHDLAQLADGGRFGAVRDAYVRRLVVPTFRAMRWVLSISEATKRDLVRETGVDAARVRVVPNGIRAMKKGAVRRSGRPYLVYPARLEHPAKNHVRLLEAFASSSLRDTHDLVLPGADWGARELLERTIASLGLADHVDLAGFVTDETLVALLEHADAVVAAGLCEGFGLPAAEALAVGLPVAFALAGALPEVVGALGAGFDPYSVPALRSSLERVIHDEALRARCRAEGPVRAALFSWTRAVSSTADALTEAAHEAA
jgi:glycosyltransferase involved in cell wall biosynthesis